MKASEFVNGLTNLDPEYLLVPEGVDLSGVEVLRVERSFSSYTYPDGVYWDRERSRFEELVTTA